MINDDEQVEQVIMQGITVLAVDDLPLSINKLKLKPKCKQNNHDN